MSTSQPGELDSIPHPQEVPYRLYFENANDALLVVDTNGCCLDANHQAEKLTGYRREELLRLPISDLFTDVKSCPIPTSAEDFKRMGAMLGESTIRRKDGSLLQVEYSAAQVAPDCYQASLRDITTRKQSEAVLAEERNLLRTLIDHLPDFIFVKDTEGRFVIINQAFASAVQQLPEALIGKTAGEILPSELASQSDMDDKFVIQSGQALINTEHTATDTAHNMRSVLSTKVPLRDQTGQVIGLVGITRDITQQKQAEETLRKAEAAAHEQRVLVAALRDSTATLLSTLDPQVMLARILENVGRVVPHDTANIMLIEGDTARVAYWNNDKYPGEFKEFARTAVLPLDNPTLQTMIKSNGPILIADTAMYPAWNNVPQSAWIRSYIGAPLRAHGIIIGFLNLNSATPGFFVPAHAELLQAFADQAVVAIENAQLYDELQRNAQSLHQHVEQRTAQLNESKEHVEAILNNSNDAIVVTDLQGIIEQKNPSFRSLFGYQLGEARGQHFTALAAPGSIDTLREAFAVVVAEVQVRRIELIAACKDGTEFDVDMVLSPIIRPDGTPSGVVFGVRDITHQKRLEAGLRQSLKQEKELNELKSRFITTASHEFRTPLTTILGSSELLDLAIDKMSAQQRQKHLFKIKSSVKRMTQLLDDTLTINKSQMGHIDFQPEPLDPFEWCRHLVEEVQKATGKTHRIVFADNGTCANTVMDKILLRHILSNLLSNAIKYSPEGSHIHFDLACNGRQAIFSIQDTGIGIPEEDLKHLFEPFHRAKNAINIQGTGLGLAIAKQAVDAHHGTINFETQLGVGTTFRVILPTIVEV